MPEEQSAIYPAHSDMRLLKIIRRSRVIVVLLALAITGYLVSNMFQVTQQPEWLINDSQANISKVQVSKLSAEQQLIYHWNNLLEDRSKGWIAMELLSRLATENRGLLIRSFSHAAKPESASGQPRIGFTREWKINGFARDEAVQFLNHLNTRDGAEEFFTEISETSGNTSYLPKDGDRSITINMRTLENSSFKLASLEQAILTDDSSYPFTFDLTITQRFESTDPMALNTNKAP